MLAFPGEFSNPWARLSSWPTALQGRIHPSLQEVFESGQESWNLSDFKVVFKLGQESLIYLKIVLKLRQESLDLF